MLGYADDEIEPHVSAWEQLLHPDDWAARRSAERRRRSAGEPTYEGEFRLRHKDGHYITVLTRGLADPPRRRRTGRAHRRHPSRHHRAQADRSGAARERGAADAGVRRRAGRHLGLEPRDQRGRLFVALEADARLRRRRDRAAHQRVGAARPSRRPGAGRPGARQRRPRPADLRGRVPAAAQGRTLRPRPVARVSGSPRSRRAGRPDRRHALRSDRAPEARSGTRPHGAAGAPGLRPGRRAAADRARHARPVRRAADGA